MNRAGISKPMVIFCILALLLIGFGLFLIADVYHEYESVVFSHTDHTELYTLLHQSAIRLMAGGGMLVGGLGLLVVLLLHLVRRTARIQREAEALQKKYEAMDTLNRRTRELAHHQRLEIIGTLTSSIAHEFNNLLTPIMGYSMMALEKLPPEEEALYDDLLEIYDTSRKAKTIIARLSDLARKNPSHVFRSVSPDELIRKTLDVATPARPPRVEVRAELNCWDQRIVANELQLSQLLLNLILNGFHAMGDEDGVLSISTSFDEALFHIRVADTGTGIPEDVLPRIYEPFFTTKEAGKGTGLGLAIVAQVVDDHHGTIRVETKPGEGTAFTVSIPRNLPEADTSTETDA